MQVSVFRGPSHAQSCVMSRRIVQSRTCYGVTTVSRPRDLVSCCAAPCCIAHMQDSAEACRDEGETMADPVKRRQVVDSKDYPNRVVISKADSVVLIGPECIVTGDRAEVTERVTGR